MSVAEVINTLRDRYFVCKGARTAQDVAEEMGVTRQTLARFARGGFVGQGTLAQIEAWVEAREAYRRRKNTCPVSAN